jgi:hypothetical protein
MEIGFPAISPRETPSALVAFTMADAERRFTDCSAPPR